MIICILLFIKREAFLPIYFILGKLIINFLFFFFCLNIVWFSTHKRFTNAVMLEKKKQSKVRLVWWVVSALSWMKQRESWATEGRIMYMECWNEWNSWLRMKVFIDIWIEDEKSDRVCWNFREIEFKYLLNRIDFFYASCRWCEWSAKMFCFVDFASRVNSEL